MAAVRGLLGAEATLNYNSASYNSPTFTAMTAVSDLSMTGTWDKGEGSSRASRAKTYLKTMLDVSITGKLKSSDSGDTDYTAVITSFLAPDSIINIMVLNGGPAVNGAWGFMFDAQVAKAGGSQNLGDVEFDDIEFFPATSGNPLQCAVVAAGAPVFTAI